MLHQAGAIALGRQATKGTEAATFVRGRTTSSRVSPRYDRTDNTGEHTGVHERPTSRQSTAIRNGYVEDVSFTSRLYPLMLPFALIMAGFACSSSANGDGSYDHTLTLAGAGSQSYGSVLHALGEGGSRFTRAVTDVKLSALNFTANKQGISYTGTGLGISQATASGETITAELDYLLSAYNGSWTVTSSDITAATLGTPQGMTVSIANPLGEDDQALFGMSRANLVSTGIDITGTASGLTFSQAILREWNYGSNTGTGLDRVIPVSQLSWVWQSPAEIPSVSGVYFKTTWTIPVTQGFMQPVDITGGGRILYDLNWEMTDATATAPITVVVRNNKSAYTAD